VRCFSNEEEETSTQQNTVCNFCHVSRVASEPTLGFLFPDRNHDLLTQGDIGFWEWKIFWSMESVTNLKVLDTIAFFIWPMVTCPVNFLLPKCSIFHTSILCEMSYSVTAVYPKTTVATDICSQHDGVWKFGG
jgi:hypothetical protein